MRYPVFYLLYLLSCGCGMQPTIKVIRKPLKKLVTNSCKWGIVELLFIAEPIRSDSFVFKHIKHCIMLNVMSKGSAGNPDLMRDKGLLI